MGRFGFGKKKEEDDEPGRMALFGSRSKAKSPATSASNPYATTAAPPDPYTQAKMNAGLLPPTQAPQNPQQQSGYTNPRSTQQSSGFDNKASVGQNSYGPNKYGNEGGYGTSNAGVNPYASTQQTNVVQRAGGYGGLGPRTRDDEPDESRDALFGAAPQRVRQQEGDPPEYSSNGVGDPADSQSYGAYGDRQLTAEEEEEQDITATKHQIRQTKQDDIASLQRINQAGTMAEETARNTLARLGAQGERLHNTKKNLDLAQNQIDTAEDRTAELQRLNRSMFIPANSPFGRKGRLAREEEKIITTHRMQKETREDDRARAYDAEQRKIGNFKEINKLSSRNPTAIRKPNLAERGKYQFEADSDDERMEDTIDDHLDTAQGTASRLKFISQALGAEIESQNTTIEAIAQQSDAVDDRVVTQTARLKRIK